MGDIPRKFRSDASLEAESVTRDAIVPFLEQRGFTAIIEQRRMRGSATTQVVAARTAAGQPVKIHVRLCWRRDGRNPRERAYAAAQLRARLIDNDWDATLEFIEQRDRDAGHTHTLIVQYDAGQFVYAALLPCDQIGNIWRSQREISGDLIRRGEMGRVTKNHATNGASPTVWLQDDRTPEAHAVPDVLWSWPGVIDLLEQTVIADRLEGVDDTFDDCPAISYLGRDAAEKVHRLASGYPRDPRVRQAVIARAAGRCERSQCGESRKFAGFLDVHHILGVGTSDRIWNCVALCPNCHRDAHLAPNGHLINAELQEYGATFERH